MAYIPQSMLLIEWPNSIRIKYHEEAIKNPRINHKSSHITESYFIPPDIWEQYKHSFYKPKHINNYPKQKADILWSKFDKTPEEDLLEQIMVSLWIENYNLKNFPIKSQRENHQKETLLQTV